ncbi:MAG: HU family DNA-binding protein [Clostridia bacterium]|nr:HU family DNA-binding protein [Clostridia bacterium]MBR2160460.1 HU family DNA-binding protein [Clostridia bacterium]MBR2323497.1 HU family DNA-binding protein [Clostridia bacterium]MBR2397405.1 HU family DNA-binding protein [Clostridia bacterium]MBR2496537.1 HU family DNA-binding protein [Clostridia bacterium]
MNKCEFIKAFAANVDISQKDAAVVYDAFIGTLTSALKKGEKVQLTGFATFEVKNKPAREGINPKTKEKISIEASKTPVVKFGNAYKAQF